MSDAKKPDEQPETSEIPETPENDTPPTGGGEDVGGGVGEERQPRGPADAGPPERETGPGPAPGTRPETPRPEDGPRPAAAGSSAAAPKPGVGRPELPAERAAGREERDASAESGPEQRSGPPDGAPAAGDALTGRQRLAGVLWPPRVTRAQLIVALLLFVLGLGLAIQVRSTSESSPLRGARQEDLVRILDELDDRSARLEDERGRLEDQRRELENSSDQAEEARRQTRQKQQQLGVLAGTVGAQGPGLQITVADPGGAVEADMLLDAIQELRAAGAEAIEINGVRVVAGTYFTDSDGGVRIDGHKVTEPFRFEVIGEPQDLEPALNIPGGVVQTLEKEQATVEVTRSEKIVVDALRSAKRPDYARSSR